MEIIDNLFQRRRFNIKPGLERTLLLAKYYGNPQNQFQSIHIAGTNGKGSTASMLASVLMEAGYKVGLYTSPHIKKFNERIRINGRTISDDNLKKIAEDILEYSDEIKATFFEITTIMAFKYFADENVDFAIIESGMGGRYDSTNIITPIISVITQIANDHSEYLGDTIEKIAYEKAGIIKNNIPAIIAENDINIINVIKGYAITQKASLSFSNDIIINRYSINKDLSMIVEYEYNKEKHSLKMPLAGKHQLINLKLALLVLHNINELGKVNVNQKIIHKGIKKTLINSGLKSRIELMNSVPPIIFDSAHNPEAISALVNFIKESPYKNEKWLVIFGAMSDKDTKKMLETLNPVIDTLILTKPNIERAESTDVLNTYAKLINIHNIIIQEDIRNSYKYAKTLNKPILATGSFYLIAELD